MALRSAGGSTERIDCGAGATLDNVNTGTMMMWLNLTTITPGVERGFWGKSTTSRHQGIITGAGRPQLEIGRATTVLRVGADAVNIPGYGANKWCFLAMTWNSAGVGGDQQIYGGDSATTATVVGTYFTQQVGAGAVSDDSADAFMLMNIHAVNASMPGDLGMAHLVNRVLTLNEIQQQQRRPRKIDGSVLLMFPGIVGTGTQPDWSGNGNVGTVTGATVAAHVPLGPMFGEEQDDDVVLTAAATALIAQERSLMRRVSGRVFGRVN